LEQGPYNYKLNKYTPDRRH